MPKKLYSGFTLIELVVVLIIIAILATLGLPIFEKTSDGAHKKEAIAMLRLISGAEQLYKVNYNVYYPGSGTASFDDATRNALLVSLYDNQDWVYTLSASGSGTSAMATATATRQRGRHVNDLITMDVSSGNVILEYTW